MRAQFMLACVCNRYCTCSSCTFFMMNIFEVIDKTKHSDSPRPADMTWSTTGLATMVITSSLCAWNNKSIHVLYMTLTLHDLNSTIYVFSFECCMVRTAFVKVRTRSWGIVRCALKGTILSRLIFQQKVTATVIISNKGPFSSRLASINEQWKFF